MSEAVSSSTPASSLMSAIQMMRGKRAAPAESQQEKAAVEDSKPQDETDDTHENKRRKTTDTASLSPAPTTSVPPIAPDESLSTDDAAALVSNGSAADVAAATALVDTSSMSKEETEALHNLGLLPTDPTKLAHDPIEPVKKRRGRLEGAGGYDESNLRVLMSIIKQHVPPHTIKIGTNLWSQIAIDYNMKTKQNRSAEALRKKFESLREDMDDAIEASRAIADFRYFTSARPAAALFQPSQAATPTPAVIWPPIAPLSILPPTVSNERKELERSNFTSAALSLPSISHLTAAAATAGATLTSPFPPLPPVSLPLSVPPLTIPPRTTNSSATAVESLIEAQHAMSVQLASIKQELQQVVTLLQTSNEKQASQFAWQNFYSEQQTKLLERLVSAHERPR